MIYKGPQVGTFLPKLVLLLSLSSCTFQDTSNPLGSLFTLFLLASYKSLSALRADSFSFKYLVLWQPFCCSNLCYKCLVIVYYACGISPSLEVYTQEQYKDSERQRLVSLSKFTLRQVDGLESMLGCIELAKEQKYRGWPLYTVEICAQSMLCHQY